jgi:outer membrane biosynthesis protein TonB
MPLLAAPLQADDAYHRCSDADLAAFRERAPSTFNPAEFVLPKEPAIKGFAGGFVDLLVRLDIRGRVRKACVVDSAPLGVFETVSVEAVRQWRYAPADIATLPDRDRRAMKVRVGFTLKD